MPTRPTLRTPSASYPYRELVQEAIRRYLAGDPEFVNLDFVRHKVFSRRQLKTLETALAGH